MPGSSRRLPAPEKGDGSMHFAGLLLPSRSPKEPKEKEKQKLVSTASSSQSPIGLRGDPTSQGSFPRRAVIRIPLQLGS